MDYSAMIQNRKSVRAFQDREVPGSALAEIKEYFLNSCKKLIPSIDTQVRIFGSEVKKALEGAAGYEQLMIGAPCYLLLFSENAEYAAENAGYITEDLVLKLTEMDLNSCWLTFSDGEQIKESLALSTPLSLQAIIAFGYGKKTSKLIRLNIKSMSDVDADIKREYYSPKLGIGDLVFSEKWGNKAGVNDLIGDMESMLWRAFYAASLAPSYLNRQPFGFVLHGTQITLVLKKDTYTGQNSAKLNLGIVMLHFAGVVSQWTGHLTWNMGAPDTDLGLPEGCTAVAWCKL